jgi:hypothetical protein
LSAKIPPLALVGSLQCPEEQAQHSIDVDRIECELGVNLPGLLLEERFLHGVKHRSANVAVHDSECAQRQSRQAGPRWTGIRIVYFSNIIGYTLHRLSPLKLS